MTTYKYTDVTNTVVHVIDDDGISRSSMLATLVPDNEAIEAYVPTTAELNAPIYAQLDALDKKLIRPLSEGETDRVAEIVAQKAALRSQLV